MFTRKSRQTGSRDSLESNNYPDYETPPIDDNDDESDHEQLAVADEPMDVDTNLRSFEPDLDNESIRLNNSPIETETSNDGLTVPQVTSSSALVPVGIQIPPADTFDEDETNLAAIIEREGRLAQPRQPRRLSKTKTSNGFNFDTKTPSEIYFNNDPLTVRVVPPILQYIPNLPNNVFYVQKAIDNLKYYLQNIIDYNEMNLLTFFISYDADQEHKIYFESIVTKIIGFGPNADNRNRVIDLFEYYYYSFINIFDVLLHVVVNINYSTDEPRTITYSLMNFINGCAQFIEDKMIKRLESYGTTRSSINPIDNDTVYRIKDIQSDLTNLYNSKLTSLKYRRFYKYTSNNLDTTFELPRQPKDFSLQIHEIQYNVDMVNTDLYI
jgi:hypothetical protein